MGITGGAQETLWGLTEEPNSTWEGIYRRLVC